MDLFKDLKLVSKKDNFVITYKNDSFIQVKKKALARVFKDVAHKSFFNKFLGISKEQVVPSHVEMEANQLLNFYNAQKKIFYNGMRVTPIKNDKPDFKYFIEAVGFLRNFKLTQEQFLQSQIMGLAFVNNGKGKFPDPKQLANDKTEDRILDYVQKRGIGSKSERPKVFLSENERQLDLRDNPKFMGIWNRFKNNDNISLDEACYIDLCIKTKRGAPRQDVTKYIEKLLNG